MRADQVQAVLSLVMLFAVLVLLVVVVRGQQAREAAVVRIQGCVVQMLLVTADERAELTVADFERLCPGVRDVLEEEQ